MGRINSLSPVRSRKSPRTKSPSLRERSPVRQRAAYAEKLSSRDRSRKHVRSRSPEHHSPPREKLSSRTKSSKRGKSSSPDKEEYPPRTRSPKRVKLMSSVSPSREKLRPTTRTRSPRRARSRSLESSSLSPRSKRLMRAKAERDPERGSVKGNEVNHGRKGDRSTYMEKDSYREFPVEKEDRRPRNSVDNDSSKSRHRRAAPPSANHRKDQRRSRSPSDSEKKGRVEIQSSRDAEQGNGDNDSIAKMKAAEDTLEAKEVKEKQKPSFELSGKLAAETNRFRGVTLLFNEPPDARKPDVRWRLYVFKGGEVLNEPLYVHRQSCYLFGRERRVADIPTDHPSCSKQHAVLQYREVEEENPDGTMSKRVRPYLMDLGTTNGTSLNDSPIEPQRYYELFEKDTIKFGNSSREYVLLHENSAT